MVYRSDRAPSQASKEARERLGKLARAGRKRRVEEHEAALVRQQAAELRKQAAEERSLRRQARQAAVRRSLSTTRWAVLGRAGRLYGGSGAVLIAGTAMIPLFIFFVPLWVTLGLIAGLAVAPLFLVGIARAMARRGLEREQAWVAGLRYPIEGHFELLGGKEPDKAWIVLDFVDEVPTVGLVADLCTAVAEDTWSPSVKGMLLAAREVQEQGNRMALPWRRPGGVENRAYHMFMRALVPRVLDELHAVYPIRVVHVIVKD